VGLLKYGECELHMENLRRMLQKVYGPQATFREGQEEAVRSVLDGKRVLVVQKTGWGKSLVYFLSAKILRQRGKGLCIIISPLLALMRNQLDAAKTMPSAAFSFAQRFRRQKKWMMSSGRSPITMACGYGIWNKHAI